jgi:hypothetical protein
VVELRERRHDDEEVAAEVSRALEGLTKDKTMLGKKARLLDTALAAINQVARGQGPRCFDCIGMDCAEAVVLLLSRWLLLMGHPSS